MRLLRRLLLIPLLFLLLLERLLLRGEWVREWIAALLKSHKKGEVALLVSWILQALLPSEAIPIQRKRASLQLALLSLKAPSAAVTRS
jgi:hypothetical protein